MVWAATCEIGCALVECPDLYFDYYHYDYDYPKGYGSVYFFVCYYGPGIPGDPSYAAHRFRPYKYGSACKYCHEPYPLCDTNPSHYKDAPTQDLHIYPTFNATGDVATGDLATGDLATGEQADLNVTGDPVQALGVPSSGGLCCKCSKLQDLLVYN